MRDLDKIFPAKTGSDTPGATASYIACLAEELSQLAKRNGLDALSYILDMAHLEADQMAQELCPKRGYSRSLPPGAGS
jgi:hypothetical protein